MDLAKHCELCDNQTIDYRTGSICSLTNEKPRFNKVCPSILLNEKFEEKLKETIVGYKSLLKEKAVIYTHAIVFTLIAIAVLFVGYFFYRYLFDYGAIAFGPFLIIGVGLLLLSRTLGSLFSYKKELNMASNKLNDMNELLASYNISYTYSINSWEKIHGNNEVDIELKFRGREFIVPFE